MISLRKELSAVLLVACCLLGSPEANAEMGRKPLAAAILFEQFETVAYADTDILSSFDNHHSNQSDNKATLELPLTLRLPFVQFIGGLRAVGQNTIADIERDYGAVLMGAKDFKAPEGLGMVSSRDCYIGILTNGTQPNVDSDFRHTRFESIEGKPAWTWSVPPYEGNRTSTTFYAAQVAGSYFVLANSRQEFQETIRRLSTAESVNTALTSVFGWDTFSTQKYWAYRWIRRSDVNDNNATGLADLTSAAVALSFFADVDKGESHLQVYSSDRAAELVPKNLPVSDLLRFQSAGAGIWQAIIPLSKEEAVNRSLFGVFYFLGFGVAL